MNTNAIVSELPPKHELYFIWTMFAGPIPIIGMAKRKPDGSLEVDSDGYAYVKHPFLYLEDASQAQVQDAEKQGPKAMRIGLNPIMHIIDPANQGLHILVAGRSNPVCSEQLKKLYFNSVMRQRAEASGLTLP
jgi:hypothetical protein